MSKKHIEKVEETDQKLMNWLSNALVVPSILVEQLKGQALLALVIEFKRFNDLVEDNVKLGGAFRR
jgi:hypothetical protein